MATKTNGGDLEKQFTARAKAARNRLEGFVGTAATLSKWNATMTEAQCFETAAKMARAERLTPRGRRASDK